MPTGLIKHVVYPQNCPRSHRSPTILQHATMTLFHPGTPNPPLLLLTPPPFFFGSHTCIDSIIHIRPNVLPITAHSRARSKYETDPTIAHPPSAADSATRSPGAVSPTPPGPLPADFDPRPLRRARRSPEEVPRAWVCFPESPGHCSARHSPRDIPGGWTRALWRDKAAVALLSLWRGEPQRGEGGEKAREGLIGGCEENGRREASRRVEKRRAAWT